MTMPKDENTLFTMQVNYDNQVDPDAEEVKEEVKEEDVPAVEEVSAEKPEEVTEEKPTEVVPEKAEDTPEEVKPEEKEADKKPEEEKEDDKDKKPEEEKPEVKEELSKDLTPFIETLQPLVGEDVEIKTMEDVQSAVKTIAESNEKLKEKNTAYIQDNEKIREMFQKNPDIASMLESLASGDNPLYSMGFVKDIIDSATDEEIAEYEKGNKARNEKLTAERESIRKYEALTAQMEETNKEFDKNLKESEKAVKVWAKENSVTEERADEEIKLANKLFSEQIFKGKIDASVMDVIHTYVNRDTLVKDAMEAGRINAKNEKIVSKKLDLKTKTDGLPDNSHSDNALNTIVETYEQRREKLLGYKPNNNY